MLCPTFMMLVFWLQVTTLRTYDDRMYCMFFNDYLAFGIWQVAAWKDDDGDWYETGLHIFCKMGSYFWYKIEHKLFHFPMKEYVY
jgi:hypothetical protein